jgi:hypothetical protein
MHKAALFTTLLGLATAAGASGAFACSNFGSSNCTPPDSAYARLYAPPEAYAYVPYGYEGPVVYGYTGYAPRYYGNGPRYYGYGPSYGPRYYGYGPPIYVDE